MARQSRLDLSGYHHIVNHGVARSKVYKCDADKEKFLDLLCEACKIYKVNVHVYSLMDNNYHLLIETSSQNLSLFMRQINSTYAVYFNKKYKRIGHLWQGRYKSWHIIDEKHLYTLFRYIEHQPIRAKKTKHIGGYPFTLLGTMLDTGQELIFCTRNSKLKNEFHNKGMRELLETKFSKKELIDLMLEQKKKIIQLEHTLKQEKDRTLEEHFKNAKELTKRNVSIMNALEDGYKQAEIARYLNLTSSAVAKVKKIMT